MKQLKYMRDRSISSLEKKLNEALSEGWELFGDLTQLSGSYVQAMTKEEQFLKTMHVKDKCVGCGQEVGKTHSPKQREGLCYECWLLEVEKAWSGC